MAQETIWSDLHPDLAINGRGAITIVTDVNAIYASLENIMLTIVGERVMLRTFAINITSLLFEPIDDDGMRQRFLREFKEALEAWEPRVKIEFVDVTSDQDRGTVRIRMEMYIRGYSDIFTFDKTYKR